MLLQSILLNAYQDLYQLYRRMRDFVDLPASTVPAGGAAGAPNPEQLRTSVEDVMKSDAVVAGASIATALAVRSMLLAQDLTSTTPPSSGSSSSSMGSANRTTWRGFWHLKSPSSSISS